MIKKKGLMALALSLAIGASAVAIPTLTGATGGVEVWSTYNTLKVMQEKTGYKKLDAKLNVKLCQGETEAGQLMITPSRKVNSFELIKADLTNENGDKFGIDNIGVYVQRYIEIIQKTHRQENFDYPTGMTPDMLLPMSVAKEYKENSIQKGHNQGITVEFKATNETPAGTYTGGFTLVIDGESQTIPVTVEVWGVDVTKAYGKTLVLVSGTELIYGELNNTTEMYKKYFDTLLNEYKTCASYMPDLFDIEKVIPTLDEYWDNPNFTTYIIPTETSWYKNIDFLTSYIYTLASNSTPDRLYLSKATFTPIDEPVVDENSLDRISVMKSQLNTARQNVWEKLVEEGFFDEYGGVESDFAIALKDSLMFPSIVTSPDIHDWQDLVEVYCPPIQYYETTAQRQEFTAHADKYGYEEWYYTCLQPIYPYPSHHIDDYLISARTMRWMQKAYNLDGYLYWATNASSIDGESVDPYDVAGRYWFGGGTYNGDGFLFYPGVKYGVEGPIGSLRLDALRDGQEDYNLLCAYQEILNNLASYYALDEVPNVNDIMSSIYSTIFNQMYYYAEDDTFDIARTSLAKKAVVANGDAKFFYQVMPTQGATGTVEFYASNGSEVYLNGTKLTGVASGNGIKFVHTYSSNEGLDLNVRIVNNGKEYTFNDLAITATRGIEVATAFEQLTLTESSTKEINGDKLSITIKAVEKATAGQTLRFSPSATFSMNMFGWNISEIDSFSFDVTNVTGNVDDFEIVLTTTSTPITLDRFLLNEGETITVKVSNIYKKLPKNSTVTGIQIKFKNMNGSVLYHDKTIELTNVVYSRRAGL